MKNCPLCNHDSHRYVFSLFRNYKRVKLLVCLNCGFAFQESKSRGDYANYYSADYRVGDKKINPKNERNKIERMKKLWCFLQNEQPKLKITSTILDIGCSQGFLLDYLKNLGYQTFGVEPDKNDSIVAKKKGHSIVNGEFNNNTFNLKFDIITMFNVFEHILEPRFFIKDIYNNLNKNGLLVVNVPCLDYLTLHKGKASLFHDGHVNFFSINVLRNFLENQSFKVLNVISNSNYNSIYRPGKPKAYFALICKKIDNPTKTYPKNNNIKESINIFSDHIKSLSLRENIKQNIPLSWELYFNIKKIFFKRLYK